MENEKRKDELQTSWRTVLLRASYESATFFLTRYPYLCAVLLMVSTAEDSREKKIQRGSIKYQMAYYNLGSYFFCATVMAFDLFNLKRVFSVLTCFHLAFVAFTEYSLMYGEQVAYRLLTRNIACIGCYLMVAGGVAKNKGEADRSRTLVMFGRQVIGVYAVLSVVLAWNDKNEYQAYFQHLGRQHLITLLVLGVQLMFGLFLYSGYKVVQLSNFYAVFLLLTTVIIDADVPYWNRTTGMKTWNTATIACRHLPIIATLLLIRRGYS